MEVARLYGLKAQKLRTGQLLKVKIIDIEGRDVAILDDDINAGDLG